MTPELSSRSVDIIYACDSLRHLVLEERLLFWDLRATFQCGSVAGIVHFDIWSGPSHNLHPGLIPHVRLLDKSLGIIPDLPRILPPVDWREWSAHREPYFHNMFGLSFVETPYMISRCDSGVSRHSDMWKKDLKEFLDSDDSDYQPEDDLLDYYTTTSSESEGKNEDAGIDRNTTEAEQMTEEDILKRFRANLANYG